MPFDWINYLTLAEDLAQKPDEASKHTAISRAYYFVYNIASDRVLANSGRFPGGESSHNWCWNKYQKGPDPACMQLGINGQRMKARREWADYKKVHKLRIDDEVQLMLQEARDFQRDIGTLPARFPLP
jgi:hypothetical protein